MLIMSESVWNSVKFKLLVDKRSFQNEIIRLVISNMPNTNMDSIIMLPPIVTKEERHKIHIYSIKNGINGYSSDIGKSRIMKIVVQKDFLKDSLLK